jgi:hypothetical protein
MGVCPFCGNGCESFLGQLADASASLAAKTREYYCDGNFVDCARFMVMATEGTHTALLHLAPWDRARAAQRLESQSSLQTAR